MDGSKISTLPPSTETTVALYALLAGGLVVGVWLVPQVGIAALLVLALLALRDSKAAIQAVTLAWLLTSLNPGIYATPPVALRWLVLLAATLGLLHRIGLRGFSMLLQRYSGLLVFAGVAVASAFVSSYPALTLSKLVGFSVGVILVAGLFGEERAVGAGWTTRWFMGVFWAVLALSTPLLVMDLGYLRNASGFQGILNHPQAMGVFLAPYVAGLALATVKRGPKTSTLVALAGAGAMLYESGARTGMLATSIGIVVALAVGLASRDRGVRLNMEERRRSAVLLVGLMVTVALAQLWGSGFVSDTLFKAGGTDGGQTIVEGLQRSRGSLVEASLDRFAESPLIGNGLGVPENVDRDNVSTALGGVPISASIESGVAVTGVLEQVGLLGLLSLGLLLFQVLRPILFGRNLVALALAIAALSTNFGEATIQSFGGVGLIVWLILGWARTLSSNQETAGAR